MIVPGQEGTNVLLADYHVPDRTHVASSLETLTRFGVGNVLIQSKEFNGELYFKLLTIAKIGDLSRMTQYKSAPDSTKTAQLLTYPVLMTHDVAGYDEVLVGEDQKQHLEYASRLLNKYNSVYNYSIAIPKPVVVIGRIRDLREPEKKMSKSSPHGCLFLDDSPDVIRKKFMKATATEEGLENLGFLYKRFVGEEVPASNETLKKQLAEALIEVLK